MSLSMFLMTVAMFWMYLPRRERSPDPSDSRSE